MWDERLEEIFRMRGEDMYVDQTDVIPVPATNIDTEDVDDWRDYVCFI